MLTENISNEDINGFSPDPFLSNKDSDTRNGGVCMYFKESLPIKEKRDLESLRETIVAEIWLDRKKVFIVLSYRHPNMSNDDSVQYTSLLENIYASIREENPTVSILWGKFNATHSCAWRRLPVLYWFNLYIPAFYIYGNRCFVILKGYFHLRKKSEMRNAK